jgi:hypothetical protein
VRRLGVLEQAVLAPGPGSRCRLLPAITPPAIGRSPSRTRLRSLTPAERQRGGGCTPSVGGAGGHDPLAVLSGHRGDVVEVGVAVQERQTGLARWRRRSAGPRSCVPAGCGIREAAVSGGPVCTCSALVSTSSKTARSSMSWSYSRAFRLPRGALLTTVLAVAVNDSRAHDAPTTRVATATQRLARSTARFASDFGMSSGSYSALVFSGSSRPRLRPTSAPSLPA